MKINPDFAARHGKHLLVQFIGFFKNFIFPKTGNIIVPEFLKGSESTLSSLSELTKDLYAVFRYLGPPS